MATELDNELSEIVASPDSDWDENSDGEISSDEEDGGVREVEEEAVDSDSEVDEDEQVNGGDEEDDETDFEETQLPRQNRLNLTFRKGVPFQPNNVPFFEESFVSQGFGGKKGDNFFSILRNFLTDDIVQDIVTETNRYPDFVKTLKPTAFKNWNPVQTNEFWHFFALTLAMGINKKPSIKDYWSEEDVLRTSFFSTIMSRNRFQEILAALHFTNNDEIPEGNKDRYVKLGNFMPRLLQQFQNAINPGQGLTIDETLLLFKGRLSFKQYNPMKRARFGIKLFGLCDSTSNFVLDLLPYQGRSTCLIRRDWVTEYGYGGAAVLTLAQNYLNLGHQITIDNYFMSVKLAVELHRQKTYVLGTIQKRRKGMPQMRGKLKTGDVETYANDILLIERWSDRREVVMLNSFMPHAMEHVNTRNPFNSRPKPKSVAHYNSTMGSLDNVDRVIRSYQFQRKTYKWYKKVAFTLLDMAVFNCFVMHNALNKPPKRMPYKNFLITLIHEILEKFPVVRKPRGRPTSNTQSDERLTGRHFPQKMTKKGKSYFLKCALCGLRGKRKMTCFKCTGCEKFLCITNGASCFEEYHTVRHLPKRKRTMFIGNDSMISDVNTSNDSGELPASSLVESENDSSASISLLHFSEQIFDC